MTSGMAGGGENQPLFCVANVPFVKNTLLLSNYDDQATWLPLGRNGEAVDDWVVSGPAGSIVSSPSLDMTGKVEGGCMHRIRFSFPAC